MKKKEQDSTNIVLGVVIGAVVGGGLFHLWSSSHKKETHVLDKVGKAISDIGMILENSTIDDKKEAVDEIEKSLPKGEHPINSVLTWVATGISLWKNIKKG